MFSMDDIDSRSVPVPECGCHLWLNPPTNRGYGQIKQRGKSYAAHRVAYEVFVGPIPEGMCVMHKCDTPLCVNPRHLHLGTHAQNMADRDRKGRQATSRPDGKYLAARRIRKKSTPGPRVRKSA